MKTVAFVPLKLNNERLPGKNTKRLGGDEPLYHRILRSLKSVSEIDEIYVFCSSDGLDDIPPGVTYLQRDKSLDLSSTKINEVMIAFGRAVAADVYVLAHATAPFLSAASIAKVVHAVTGGEHDSAMTVTALHEFLWMDGEPLNYNPAHIPRTQDLMPVYMETSGVYAYTDTVLSQGRRVGSHPALISVSKIESIDINESIDWDIAEAVYRQTRSRKLES
jgi:CMP-N-acetylneuraminic acid synthetase